MKQFSSISFILSTILLFTFTACTYDTLEESPTCEQALEIEVLNKTETSCGLAIGAVEISVKDVNARLEPVEFSLDGTNFQSSTSFQDLEAGTYTLTARDNSCEATLEFTIENQDGLNADLTTQASDCGNNTGKINITTNNEAGQVTYALNDGSPQTSPVFENLAPGDYQVKVSDDSGCSVELEATITTDASYAKIENLMQKSCAISGCHDGSISPDLRTKNTIIDRANRIRIRTANRSMPPSGSSPLTDAEIADIDCWVSDGAPD